MGQGMGCESSLILIFEIDVSPHTLTSVMGRIFVYKSSTTRRAVCTCVYKQIFFVHSDWVHNVGEPVQLCINYTLYHVQCIYTIHGIQVYMVQLCMHYTLYNIHGIQVYMVQLCIHYVVYTIYGIAKYTWYSYVYWYTGIAMYKQ